MKKYDWSLVDQPDMSKWAVLGLNKMKNGPDFMSKVRLCDTTLSLASKSELTEPQKCGMLLD